VPTVDASRRGPPTRALAGRCPASASSWARSASRAAWVTSCWSSAGTPSRPTARRPTRRRQRPASDARHMALPHASSSARGRPHRGRQRLPGRGHHRVADHAAAPAARTRQRAGHAGPAVRRAGRRAGAGLGGAGRHRRRAAQGRRGVPAGSPRRPARRRTAGRWPRSCTPCTRRCASRCRPCRSTPAAPRLFVDQLYAVDERSFYVRGWMRDADAEVTRLVMVSPEGATADILPSWRATRVPTSRPSTRGHRCAGASADRTGFLAAFTLDAPSRLGHGGKVEMHNAVGDAVEAPAPRSSRTAGDPRGGALPTSLRPGTRRPFSAGTPSRALSRLVAHRTAATR
jgi:hypothetical protein